MALLSLQLGLRSFAASASQPPPDAWPTIHGDWQRSGCYRAVPKGPLKLAWRKELWRELTAPRAEVIVGGGLAYMGTYAGNFYAWDAGSGSEKWVFKTGGPIGHSPMFHDGVVVFGSMDRRLYAVDVATGRMKWQFEAGEGIWVSPVVWRGLVLFGARDGVFHALRFADGQPVWRFVTGDRILTSAAISEDGERALFASEDMHLYCLDVQTGRQVWLSRKLAGLSSRDYSPVVVGGWL